MDNFETPYEEEAHFIECTVCDKSIRGDTLYKIHLTAPAHIKKEDDLIASGLAVRRNFVPVFEDIFQYLDYLKLDEAIIGLDYLDQLSWSDLQSGPRYSCRLCSHQISNLQDIVLHVIGRKHRQKYMETKRPELLTRNKQFILTQSGKAIRARAEIIERQDGRGTPVIIVKKGIDGKSNISRVPPRQEHNRGRNTPQSSMLRVVPSHRPGPKDHQDKYAHTRKPPAGYPNPPPFPPGDPRISNRDRPMYQEEDSLRHGRMEEELRRADFRQSEMYRRECMDPDFRVEYENNYPQRRGAREPVGGLRYDSMEEMLHHQHVEHYAEEAPPYRRPPPERDQLKEFYTEEVRRRQGHAEYQPSQQVYQEGHEQRRSLERESGRNNGMNRAGREGSWEQEAKRRVRPTPMESGRSHDHLFNTIIDYCHDMGEPHRVETEGPSRTGPDTSQRRMEAAGAFSEIPEPFMRFLTGAANDVGHNKRKRKSRFSDATVEEVETTNEMFNNDYGPPNPKFGGHPSHFRPETHQHPDSNIESQSPQYTEGYQRGGTESSNVFDMLKNIDIENAEEADFLKDKLCNLLKDFKNKKSAKVVQNSHGRGSISQDYNCLNPGRELSPRHQYDTPLREDSDMRRPHNLFFQEHHRGRGWQQHEPIPDEQTQEYDHPVHEEPRRSSRSCYEEVFGLPGPSLKLHANHPDEPARYPERFQEPMNPHDYLPASEKFFDPYNSAPPLNMEREPRMDRGPRYSNSLDKITSTLLELVARK